MAFSLQLPGLPGLGEGRPVDPTAVTPEEIERRRRLAMALQQQATDASPVQHWTQALARGLQGALSGYQQSQAAQQESAARQAAAAQLNALLGMGAAQPPAGTMSDYGAQPAPQATQGYAPPNAQPAARAYAEALAQQPAAPPVDPESGFPAAPTLPTPPAPQAAYAAPSTDQVAAQYASQGRRAPAAIRANNPGAMWGGDSAKRFGSTRVEMLNDGLGQGNRIAYFDTPEQGAAAGFDLLARKYVGRPLNAAMRTWTGGNHSDPYAAQVARQIGVPVDATLTPDMIRDPNVAIPMMKAMSRIEAGREYPMSDAQWAAAHQLYLQGGGGGAGNAPAAQAIQAAAGPANGLPAQAAAYQPAQPPSTAQQPQPPNAQPGQDRRAQLAQLLSGPAAQWLTPAQTALAQQMLAPQNYSYQTTPDGTILRMDPRGGAPVPVYSAPKPAQFTKIGQDDYGNDQYGFVNPVTQQITPVAQPNAAVAAAGGTPAISPPPPGVDPKTWRSEETKRLAAAAGPAQPDETTALRKEVQGLPSYKNYAQAAPIYDAMSEAAGRDTRTADLNMIYGLGKIMDPTSVVREGEMVMVQTADNLPSWYTDTVSRINQGGRLRPELRQQIMQEAYSRMQAYEGQLNTDLEQYRGIAGRRRMDERDVLPAVRGAKPWRPAAPAPPAPVATPPGADGWQEIQPGVRVRVKPGG